jgi:hypothetical protein
VCYTDKRGVLGRLSGRSHWLESAERPITETDDALGESAYHAGRLGWWAALTTGISVHCSA